MVIFPLTLELPSETELGMLPPVVPILQHGSSELRRNSTVLNLLVSSVSGERIALLLPTLFMVAI